MNARKACTGFMRLRSSPHECAPYLHWVVSRPKLDAIKGKFVVELT